tara:strand:- start:1734 stop:1937 length:204 start_codon:yes stop_codon:yes gene_type:complete
MADTKFNPDEIAMQMIEVVEQEMVLMWLDEKEIKTLLDEDVEFLKTIVSAVMLERQYWMRFMEVGEA